MAYSFRLYAFGFLQEQTYNRTDPGNKGIKQDSDPGIFPGIRGKTPFLLANTQGTGILRILK